VTATSAPTPVGDRRDIRAWRVFARTCAAEWTRLWTVQATWWFLGAAAVAMVGIGAIAGNDAGGSADPPRGEAAWTAAVVTSLPGQFAFLAIALSAVTSDYTTGGILPTLQWTTRRPVLFLARTTVAVGAATVLGVLVALAASVAAYVTARPVLTLPADEGLDTLATVAFVFAAGAAVAVGLGFVLRNTAGTLVTVFLLMLVLPIMLPNLGYEWTTELARLLPGTGAAFLLVGEVDGMTETSSRVTMLLWAGGALLLGLLRLARTDANR